MMLFSEKIIKEKYEAAGWKVLKKGAPDLLAIRGNSLLFIEVKMGGLLLTKDQKEYCNTLRRFGIEVIVERPDGKFLRASTRQGSPEHREWMRKIQTTPAAKARNRAAVLKARARKSPAEMKQWLKNIEKGLKKYGGHKGISRLAAKYWTTQEARDRQRKRMKDHWSDPKKHEKHAATIRRGVLRYWKNKA
jgi:F420H(2)-dependent quinone reductase